jgi:hypothetical protein
LEFVDPVTLPRGAPPLIFSASRWGMLVNQFLIMFTDGALTAISADRLREADGVLHFENQQRPAGSGWSAVSSIRKIDVRSVISTPRAA